MFLASQALVTLDLANRPVRDEPNHCSRHCNLGIKLSVMVNLRFPTRVLGISRRCCQKAQAENCQIRTFSRVDIRLNLSLPREASFKAQHETFTPVGVHFVPLPKRGICLDRLLSSSFSGSVLQIPASLSLAEAQQGVQELLLSCQPKQEPILLCRKSVQGFRWAGVLGTRIQGSLTELTAHVRVDLCMSPMQAW